MQAAWTQLRAASTTIYNKLSTAMKPAFFQLVHHPVLASANLGAMMVAAGQNNLRASQARLSANALADEVETLFENDFDLETQYHTLLDGECFVSSVSRVSLIPKENGTSECFKLEIISTYS
jgi:hypothetical protein